MRKCRKVGHQSEPKSVVGREVRTKVGHPSKWILQKVQDVDPTVESRGANKREVKENKKRWTRRKSLLPGVESSATD